MPRQIYVMREGKLVPIEEAGPRYETKTDAHCVIQDSMPPTEHPITGEIYESKSAFRAVTKAHGYEEVGGTWSSQEKRDKWQTENRRTVRDIHKQDAYRGALRETIRKVMKEHGYGRKK